MKTYTLKGQEYHSTREAIANGQQFPGILWAMTPGVIAGLNENNEDDLFFPADMALSFDGLELSSPFVGISFG